jgi:hypothetical protein
MLCVPHSPVMVGAFIVDAGVSLSSSLSSLSLSSSLLSSPCHPLPHPHHCSLPQCRCCHLVLVLVVPLLLSLMPSSSATCRCPSSCPCLIGIHSFGPCHPHFRWFCCHVIIVSLRYPLPLPGPPCSRLLPHCWPFYRCSPVLWVVTHGGSWGWWWWPY